MSEFVGVSVLKLTESAATLFPLINANSHYFQLFLAISCYNTLEGTVRIRREKSFSLMGGWGGGAHPVVIILVPEEKSP